VGALAVIVVQLLRHVFGDVFQFAVLPFIEDFTHKASVVPHRAVFQARADFEIHLEDFFKGDRFGAFVFLCRNGVVTTGDFAQEFLRLFAGLLDGECAKPTEGLSLHFAVDAFLDHKAFGAAGSDTQGEADEKIITIKGLPGFGQIDFSTNVLVSFTSPPGVPCSRM